MARAMKYCLLCNPDGNGIDGEEGTEAVAKYYLKKRSGQAYSGWIPVCKFCASNIKNVGFEIIYFDKKNKIEETYNCNCIFRKKNLVTSNDGDLRDIWKCEKCGREVRSVGNPGHRFT